MKSKVCHSYHLVDESPWPFLVSTASLFLTLDAVLFFDFYNDYLSCCVVSFMSLASKVKPKILYLGGSVLANQSYSYYQRNYSFRSLGIGNAKWNPDNYSKETQVMINQLLINFNNKKIESVYDIMYAVMGNKSGVFSQNYGKVTSILNNMIFFYNKKNPNAKITEKGFLDRYGFEYSTNDLNFLDHTNRGTVFTNVCESLAPQIIMAKNEDLLVERCVFMQNKVNLSFQASPEYTIGIFIKSKSSNEITLIVYDSDFKFTDPYSFCQKLSDMAKNQGNNNSYDKSVLGMNIIMMASSDDDQSSDVIFTPEQRNILINHLKKLSNEYPEQFKNFNESSNHYNEFIKTGNTTYLNESNFAVTRFYRPNDFYKISHNIQKFEETPTYTLINNQISVRENVKKPGPLIQEIQSFDDIDN